MSKRKNYLRVLLKLEELLLQTNGSVPAKQHDMFYLCLLHLEDKAGLRPNLRVKDYIALLEGSNVSAEQILSARGASAASAEDSEQGTDEEEDAE